MEKFEQSRETEKQLKQEFLEKFCHLRDDFIDASPPDEEVTLKDPNYNKYKCRGNWFQGVVGVLENVISSGLIEEKELKDQINEFNQYITEEMDFTKFTSRENIAKANKILDTVIEGLK